MLLFSIIGHAREFCEESGPILHNHHHFKSIRGPPYVSLYFILLFCKILFLHCLMCRETYLIMLLSPDKVQGHYTSVLAIESLSRALNAFWMQVLL